MEVGALLKDEKDVEEFRRQSKVFFEVRLLLYAWKVFENMIR